MFTRLPQPAALADLVAVAARSYGAPSPAHVVAGPGSQILLAQTAFLLARGRAAILAPTYAEHGRVAELAGHNVVEVAEVAQLADARIAIVVNPNNPDGRLVAKDALLALADRLRRRGGLLLVDEAFMEVGPEGASLADHVEEGNIVVLRSFGKFYGLPGLRLSFALAAPEIATRIATALGALAGLERARSPSARRHSPMPSGGSGRAPSSAEAALKLDACLVRAGLEVIGGTSLFRLVRSKDAAPRVSDTGRGRHHGAAFRRASGLAALRSSRRRSRMATARASARIGGERERRLDSNAPSAGRSCCAASRLPCASSGNSLAITPMASSTEISLAPHSLSCSRSQP